MSSPYEIQRRIRSLRNTAKVAEAIQMATSDKMRRAQERVRQSRPYSEQLRGLVSRLANARHDDLGEGAEPLIQLLTQRPVHASCFMLFTPDWGFCGTLPHDINRKAAASSIELQDKLAQRGERPHIGYVAVGRTGRDFILRNRLYMLAEFTNYGDRPSLRDAAAIAQVAIEAFLKGEVDVVYLVFAKFINTLTQQPIALQLLPVEPPAEQDNERNTVEYIYEPDPQIVFRDLIPRYVDVQVYQALLESVASTQSARLVAMMDVIADANELIHDLTSGL